MTARPDLIIIARPAGQGRCDALLDGRVLVSKTRQPLLDGARALIAEGVAPGTKLILRHEGSAVDALIARSIGEAAALTVVETDSGPRFRPWKAFPEAHGTVAGSPPIAPDDEGLAEEPDDLDPAVQGTARAEGAS